MCFGQLAFQGFLLWIWVAVSFLPDEVSLLFERSIMKNQFVSPTSYRFFLVSACVFAVSFVALPAYAQDKGFSGMGLWSTPKPSSEKPQHHTQKHEKPWSGSSKLGSAADKDWSDAMKDADKIVKDDLVSRPAPGRAGDIPLVLSWKDIHNAFQQNPVQPFIITYHEHKVSQQDMRAELSRLGVFDVNFFQSFPGYSVVLTNEQFSQLVKHPGLQSVRMDIPIGH